MGDWKSEWRTRVEATGVGQDTPLFSSGLLDSLDFVELMLDIEEEIGRPVHVQERRVMHFDTLASIAQWVERERR